MGTIKAAIPADSSEEDEMNKVGIMTRYQVREFVGSEYSKQLGVKLRNRPDAMKIVRRLKARGRTAFVAPVRVRLA